MAGSLCRPVNSSLSRRRRRVAADAAAHVGVSPVWARRTRQRGRRRRPRRAQPDGVQRVLQDQPPTLRAGRRPDGQRTAERGPAQQLAVSRLRRRRRRHRPRRQGQWPMAAVSVSGRIIFIFFIWNYLSDYPDREFCMKNVHTFRILLCLLFFPVSFFFFFPCSNRYIVRCMLFCIAWKIDVTNLIIWRLNLIVRFWSF